jgi:16S rRNA processing protein RimM
VKVAHSGGILSQEKLDSAIIFINNSPKILKIESCENKGSFSILRFQEHPTIQEVENYVGLLLYLEKEKFPRNSSEEFFVFELIGLQPRSRGVLQDSFSIQRVIENPAHPLLVFTDGQKEILVPYVNRFVGEVNLKEKWVEVHDWEDWFDEI